MFHIYYTTHEGVQRSISVVDREMTIFYINALKKAVDIHKICVVNGFTGEVLFEMVEGRITVLAIEATV